MAHYLFPRTPAPKVKNVSPNDALVLPAGADALKELTLPGVDDVEDAEQWGQGLRGGVRGFDARARGGGGGPAARPRGEVRRAIGGRGAAAERGRPPPVPRGAEPRARRRAPRRRAAAGRPRARAQAVLSRRNQAVRPRRAQARRRAESVAPAAPRGPCLCGFITAPACALVGIHPGALPRARPSSIGARASTRGRGRRSSPESASTSARSSSREASGLEEARGAHASARRVY